MSFVIEYLDGVLLKSEMLYKRETPCPSYLCKDGKTFCVGEVLSGSYDDLCALDWKNNPDILNEVVGDIAIAQADENTCSFAVDLCGIDNLFYFHRENHFILSDNIWDIVSIIEPVFTDLNQMWIKSNFVGGMINGETFIKDVFVLMPRMRGFYNPKLNELMVEEYRKFSYAGEIKTIEDATDSVNDAVDQMMSSLHAKFGNNTIYGMGLSGGLDSRIIPHYANKHHLNLVSWNICKQRPNHIFEAASVKNARNLAKVFNIPFTVVEWSNEELESKNRLKIENMPMGSSGRNVFKYEPVGIPAFDVMLSGGYGILIGDYLPGNIKELTKPELKQAMEKMFITIESTSTGGRVRRALNYIFGLNIKVHDNKIPDAALSLFENEIENARARISAYVDSHYGEYTNIELFEKYWLNYLATRDRNGAFESMFGTKRSFATYSPFIFKKIVKWDEDLLPERSVLPEFIKKYVPEAAMIGTDSYTTAPNKSSEFIWRMKSVFSRLIRGNGTAIDENNFNRKTRRIIRDTYNNEYSWFYRIVDTRDINAKVLNRKNLRIAVGIWEMKSLVDFIESQGYKEIQR